MAATEGEPNISAVVWTERAALAPRIMALDDAGFAREIARRLGDHLGAVRPIGRRWLYPLGALHAQRYTDTRLALAGDSAHGIHPIAGQGLNLGLRDCITLSELIISTLASGGDPGSPEMLADYQARRRPANLLMLAATHTLDRLFSTDNPLLRAVRDIGISGVNHLPPLKRAFMRQAMGT
jgi:2-octaprenyl-6-methoxyphenol hydroxylase